MLQVFKEETGYITPLMSSQILFNVRPHQTRMAFVKDGILRDIFYHRDQNPSLMGAIYKGKVSRLAKRLNFAFVELGLKKSGFLYGKDVVNKGNQSLSQVLKPADFILVQIKSDPARGKGPRLTQELSFSGRYLVYMPTQAKKVAVSRRIPSSKERERLLGILKDLNEPCALIARTLAEGRKEEELKKDLELLKLKWNQIQEAYEQAKGIRELQKGVEPGLAYLTDLMDDTVETVWVDDKQAVSKVRNFVKDLQPDLKSRVKFFSGNEGLFKKFDIESQIQKAGQKKVYLKNGGSIIIEELEAFSVIDVNSGRFMGKGEQQDAILSVNLSAARVIAQQIRLRHLAGIILIDFIDMESEKHREKLVSVLEEEFSDDRSRPRVFPMVELGLVQITRKRERHPLSAFLSQNCPICDGRGHIKSYSAIAGEIFQTLEELAQKRLFLKKALSPRVTCHPKIEEWMKKETKSLEFLKKEFRITPEFIPDPLLPTQSFMVKRS